MVFEAPKIEFVEIRQDNAIATSTIEVMGSIVCMGTDGALNSVSAACVELLEGSSQDWTSICNSWVGITIGDTSMRGYA